MPSLIAFDTETHIIQPGLLAPPIVCGSFAEERQGSESVYLRDPTIHLLQALLEQGFEIVGANIAYDFGCVATARPDLLPLIFKAYDEGRVFDVLIAQALIDIGAGVLFRDPATGKPFERYSLALCAARNLGLDLSAEKKGPDAWRLRYHELDGVPLEQWPEEAREYPKHDARHTYDVAAAQKRDGTNLHCMAEQARAAWGLHLSAIWGMKTDPQTVGEVVAEVEKGHREALARFAAVGIYRPDGTKDTKKLAAMVSDAYAGNPPQTDTGRVSTNRDTLKESGNELLEDFAEVGENEKWRSTYLPVLQAGTKVPINPETNVLVATGRSSYRKPNLQNLPRNGRIRECFVPRPGHVLASVDYGTLELCTLAQVTLWWVGHSAMADAINAGRDLHYQFGARVAGVPYEELRARGKAGDKQAKNFRQMSKAANFGLPGGLGAAKLVAYARQSYDARFCLLSGRAEKCGTEMVVDERTGKPICAKCLEVARELKSLWFEEWPEVGEYHAKVSELTEGELGGCVQVPGPEGEGKPGLGLIRGGCHFCDGANNGFQGLAARGAKAALYRVAREEYTIPGSALWGCRNVVFVHDEIIAEVPERTAHEAAHRLSEVMVNTMREFVPDVRVTAEPALMRRWLKGAEPVFESGRLVPWEPKKS